MARPFAREGAQYSRIASKYYSMPLLGPVRRAPLVFLAPARADLSLRAVRPFVCTEQCGSERGEHEAWVNKSKLVVRARSKSQASHAARPLRATQRACRFSASRPLAGTVQELDRARRRAAHRLPLPITGAPPPAPRSTPAPKPTPAQAAPSPPRPAGPARVQPPSYPFEHRRSTLASWPASQLDSCP